MKTYLSKLLSIFLLLLAFGCSEEQSINPQEDVSNESKFNKAEETASINAQRRAMHVIYVVCPGSGSFGPTCPQDLDPSITVYNVYQSPNCPDVYMVWVDSLEYYAIYSVEPTGTRHVLMPPYEDEPPSVPTNDNEYLYCFN